MFYNITGSSMVIFEINQCNYHTYEPFSAQFQCNRESVRNRTNRRNRNEDVPHIWLGETIGQTLRTIVTCWRSYIGCLHIAHRLFQSDQLGLIQVLTITYYDNRCLNFHERCHHLIEITPIWYNIISLRDKYHPSIYFP